MADTDTTAAKLSIDDITPEEMPGLTAKILKVAKTKPNEGETALDLTRRVAEQLTDQDRTSNKVWDKLKSGTDDKAQRLLNNAIHHMVEKEEDPVLLLTLEPSSPSQDRASSEEETTMTDTTQATETAPKKKAAAKAKTAAKAKGGKAAKGKANGAKKFQAGMGRTGQFALDAKIKLLVKENPRREGTKAHKMFAKYSNGMTVEEALKKGIEWRDLAWDTKYEHIKIG